MAEGAPVERILADWLTARDEGAEIDAAEVMRANPAHRRQLERCFAAQACLRAKPPDCPGADVSLTLRTAEPEDYEDFRVLGVGGMGVVYRVTDRRLNATVALKFLRTDGVDTTKESAPASPFHLTPPLPETPAAQRFEAWKARLLQEVAITGRLAHPSIVPLFDVAQTPAGVPFYTMRYYAGLRTLATAISDLQAQTPLERLGLLESYLRLCDAIHYAHSRGVIHRDLKPENVLLGAFGEVIVVDWGLATLEGTPDRIGPAWKQRVWEHRRGGHADTEPGALGTPGYMAPEAGRGALAQPDSRTDVYSLGAVLFEILNGWTLHESTGASSAAGDATGSEVQSPAAFHPAVPRTLRDVCTRALAPDRAERYESAGELAEAIRAWRERVAARDLVEVSLSATQDALHGASGLRGEERLVATGTARETLAAAGGLEPGDPRAQAHALQVASLWRQGLKEHGGRRRRRDLVVILILAFALVFALGAAMCYVFREKAAGRVGASLPPVFLSASAGAASGTGVPRSSVAVSALAGPRP